MTTGDFANLSDRIQRARRRIVMHQADNRDIGPLVEGLPHLFGVDGLIVRHLDLKQFLVVAIGPVSEPLAVYAGHQV